MLLKLIILAVYFLVLFLIGYLSSRKVHDISDYFVGGKKLGYWVVAFSSRATGESAWLLLGLTGLGAMVGVSAFWVVVGELLGVGISWFFMAERFKNLTDKYDSITVPDYLVSRFRSTTHHLRVVASIVLSVFVIIYVAAQIDATGSAFEAFLQWNYFTGALVGFTIVVIYILFGGFVAVAWSDVFQGSLMFLGLVLLPMVVIFSSDFDGGVINSLTNIDPGLTNIWGAGGMTLMNVSILLGYLFIGLGFLGSPQLFVRFMAIKSTTELKKASWIAMAFTLLTDAGAVLTGIFARYLFTEQGVDPEAVLGINGQNSLILMVENLLPVVLMGLYVAVVLSAIMSTIDSLLVVASSAVVRDIYQQILHPNISLKKLTAFSRKVTLGMALIALLIAISVAILSPTRTIFWFVIFGWSGISASFCPVIILSLFWKAYTEKAAIATMITGFLGVPIFKFVVPNMPIIGEYFEHIAELGPSFALAMVVGFLVTKMYPDPELAKQFSTDLADEKSNH